MATEAREVQARRSITGAQLALVLLGLVVLLIAVWFLFLRSGEDELVPTPPVTQAQPTPEPEPEETSEPRGSRKGPLETFEVFAPKDPFRPLISTAAGSTGGTATAGVSSVPAAEGDASTPPSAPSGGSDIGGDDSRGGGESVGGRRVRLVDTFRADGEQRARVQVDGTVYTVAEGDRFADSFQLISISGDCVSMLYGDDQFSLCEGEEILK